MSKNWNELHSAAELAEYLKSQGLDYCLVNYGEGHALTKAAEAGDLEAFRAAGASITALQDVKVAGLVDKITVALGEHPGA
ncbi:hypothetical protein HNP46_006328 [Pseudomonas nitritireducens]|uniref:Uncharacterized protein n=1 Tax=Pseudomonas nitroreducens TaxID=46680 RepID=A0A7W7KR21_PSENT|nr:hypothetical protein [Pseudomonas nitritireducens]MBB4867415.1 hypothetical protein [Pseudomonas nitritireducens]